MKKIAIIVGSLRKGSFNRMIANELIKLAPNDLKLEIVEINNLPLYNQDFDDNSPKEYTEFREKIKSADGFIFASPEHNRSYPAAIKNALDVASRPWGQNVWSGKPGAIITASPGTLGGFGANHHLRQVCAFLNIYMMQQPEAYVNVANIFDENGNITNEGSKKFLQAYIDAFDLWVKKF